MGPPPGALSLVPGGLASTLTGAWGAGLSLGTAHPGPYLAGVLLALGEASTQHVILDGFWLEAGLGILAVEQVALGRVNDGHSKFLQDPGVGQVV